MRLQAAAGLSVALAQKDRGQISSPVNHAHDIDRKGSYPVKNNRWVDGGSNETQAIRRPPTSFSATAIGVRRRSGEFSPRPTSRRLIGLDAYSPLSGC
ncbi:MAG TPA: hypothetical protein VKU03_14205, partial [Roseiarcus sp.]|nr:hypothetical protein [Roseiarcus sp.]